MVAMSQCLFYSEKILMESLIKSWIVQNRRSWPVSTSARLARRFLNAYYNTGQYDFNTNGESYALRTFARIAGKNPVIWDVGAHYGEYAQQAHEILPAASIISFEILPPIANQMRKSVEGEWLELIELRLSDSEGTVEIVWNKRSDASNAISHLNNEFFSHNDLERVACQVTTADALIATGTPRPDFLKIDVEGHEPAVLRGARDLLNSDQPPVMIQFEYGQTWIAGSGLLHNCQTFLEDAGYKVGRLFPNHVEFKDYAWDDEHFRMGNMIAIRDHSLAEILV